jgi:hypothetical protein
MDGLGCGHDHTTRLLRRAVGRIDPRVAAPIERSALKTASFRQLCRRAGGRSVHAATFAPAVASWCWRSIASVARSAACLGEAYVTQHEVDRTPDNSRCRGYEPQWRSDAFLIKLSHAGNALAYRTYLGGSGADVGQDVAVDLRGAAYATEDTSRPTFPPRPAPTTAARTRSSSRNPSRGYPRPESGTASGPRRAARRWRRDRRRRRASGRPPRSVTSAGDQ